MTKQGIPSTDRLSCSAWAIRTLAVAALVATGLVMTVPTQVRAGGQMTEQKAKTLIVRNTKYLFDMAHTGANTMTMQYKSTTQNFDGSFSMKYYMTWISSVTKNKNDTNWTFNFDKTGRFLSFNMTTSWPSGDWDLANVGIELVRKSFLNHGDVKNALANNPNLEAAIRSANAQTLTAIWLSIDQSARP